MAGPTSKLSIRSLTAGDADAITSMSRRFSQYLSELGDATPYGFTRERYLDMLGAVNLIPGPNSTELAISIGMELGGRPGLLVSGVCFIGPAFLIVLSNNLSSRALRSAEVDAYALKMTEVVQNEVVRGLTAAATMMIAMGRSEIVDQHDAAACQSYTAAIRRDLVTIMDIAVADATGRLYCHSGDSAAGEIEAGIKTLVTGRPGQLSVGGYTQTSGAHLDYTWGGDRIALHAGAAYDDAFRAITGIDASQQWQNAICGDNPNVFLPAPNSQPACRGLNVAGTTATVNAASPGQAPAYPGYGTGYSAGFPALAYGGSLVPQTALAS